jgi:hypothetical protein
LHGLQLKQRCHLQGSPKARMTLIIRWQPLPSGAHFLATTLMGITSRNIWTSLAYSLRRSYCCCVNAPPGYSVERMSVRPMPPCWDRFHSGWLCWIGTRRTSGIKPLTVQNGSCLIHPMKGYWEDILKHCLVVEDTSRCRVPRNMAISVKLFSETCVTFDEHSILHLGESHLRAEGEHNRARTQIIAAWDEIQSITFAYKKHRGNGD